MERCPAEGIIQSPLGDCSGTLPRPGPRSARLNAITIHPEIVHRCERRFGLNPSAVDPV